MRIQEVCKELNEEVEIHKAIQLGKRSTGAPQKPTRIKVMFTTEMTKRKVQNKAKGIM